MDTSYGYRPRRSPVDAVAVCRKRCWEKNWIVDLDVKAFFDSVSWDLVLKAVARHTDRKWVLLYVGRWLKAPMLMPDGTLAGRTQGTPQGGPISPLLANVFLHYGFDSWMAREYPGCPFERFADDAVIHCVTERQALEVRDAVGHRFASIGLTLHPDKTKIVFCKDGKRRRDFPVWSFTFCGYEFRPRRSFNKETREAFTNFLPAAAPGRLFKSPQFDSGSRIMRNRHQIDSLRFGAPAGQRLLHPIEGMCYQTFHGRRSRCAMIVCQALTQSNSTNWYGASKISLKSRGIKESGARRTFLCEKPSSWHAAICDRT